VDSRFDQNEAELGILVFSVNLEMLAHGNRLFDEMPKVFRDFWPKSYSQTSGICRRDAFVERRRGFKRKKKAI
jgi:hypothetical protein